MLRQVPAYHATNLTLLVAGPITCISAFQPASLVHKGVQSQNGTDTWQLLTGHQSGQVKLWAASQGHPQQPLAVLGVPTTSPVKSVAHLADQHLFCFAHNDGHVALHHAPEHGAQAPTMLLPGGQDTPIINLPSSSYQAHDKGLVQCITCAMGLISVGEDGTILVWPRHQLAELIRQSSSHLHERYLRCSL